MSAPDPQPNLPRDVELEDRWLTSALRRVVDSRCSEGRKPSHLFLGRKEAKLLREHLGEAFGQAAVSTFNDLYYMGMQVVEMNTPSCVRVAGEKFMDRIERSGFDLSKWSESQLSEWKLHFD